ncbi:M16 family metallopeptidase [Alistipes sp. ZOR0009]|uniref:M16 family metallopeptidase n=1 Tax=Alistipes sp. ZOR0009 TaxID=1339253 RepID=UPI000647B5E6|nr:pitrilysin family protein [Alistipes sp. ZOR0009]
MIDFSKYTLSNGLTVIAHRDGSSPIAAFNLLYKVGARNENPNRTGFAHLFEHLMFSGSKNAPSFDDPLQMAGGENNAFTNNDYTNYYETLPKENIETAFWLESDRMFGLNINEQSLSVQKNVVTEEFNQRYLNQPYGDIWLLLRSLAYQVHPYQWPTIGKEISHITNATLTEVTDFYNKFYSPNNAILSVVGDFDERYIFEMANKWFGDIPAQYMGDDLIPQEPIQTELRELEVERDVPTSALYKVYHMCDRLDSRYYATDMLSDILSNGKSARMYRSLVQDQRLFTEVNAYLTGDVDPGLFVFSGKLSKGVSFEQAEKAIATEVDKLLSEKISEYELEKVKNKYETSIVFGETSILNKGMNLGYYQMLGDAAMINTEVDKYRSVAAEELIDVASKLLVDSNSSTLRYIAKK